MKDVLAAFSLRLKEWNRIRNILLHLKQVGKTSDDLITYIESMEKEEQELKAELNERFKQLTKECPECSFSMRLLYVNVSPSTMTEDNSKSVWFCVNKECSNTIYNKEDVKTILSKIKTTKNLIKEGG